MSGGPNKLIATPKKNRNTLINKELEKLFVNFQKANAIIET